MGLAFTLITPIGIAIGVGVHENFSANGKAPLLAVGILNSISAGILVSRLSSHRGSVVDRLFLALYCRRAPLHRLYVWSPTSRQNVKGRDSLGCFGGWYDLHVCSRKMGVDDLQPLGEDGTGTNGRSTFSEWVYRLYMKATFCRIDHHGNVYCVKLS